MKKIPWIVTLLWRFLRAIGRLLYYGPRGLCWHFGCWELASPDCHAGPSDNGPMCKKHCEEATYHGKHATGCVKPPTAYDRAYQRLLGRHRTIDMGWVSTEKKKEPPQ